MIRRLIEFLQDERGATAVDYAMIAALLAVGVVGGIDILGHGADGAAVPSTFDTVVSQ
jgi:Flp pilus assembly pilin Flp